MRLIPRNLATSAAGCPTSSTASQASRDLASEYFLCLFPEHINSGLRPNFPATISISSSMGRLARYFFSRSVSDCSRVSFTKSPLPRILASPSSRSSFLRRRRTLPVSDIYFACQIKDILVERFLQIEPCDVS